jgi:hypothetical protein
MPQRDQLSNHQLPKAPALHHSAGQPPSNNSDDDNDQEVLVGKVHGCSPQQVPVANVLQTDKFHLSDAGTHSTADVGASRQLANPARTEELRIGQDQRAWAPVPSEFGRRKLRARPIFDEHHGIGPLSGEGSGSLS